MNRHIVALALALGISAGLAHAGTITQTIPYDFQITNNQTLSFAGFDDLGGTLRLDKLTFDWDMNFDLDYTIENTGPTAVNAGDFSLILDNYTIHQLGFGNGHAAYGPGGMYETIEQVALPAYDNEPGGAGVYTGTYQYGYQRTLEFTLADDPSFIADMDQAGTVDTLYGVFGGIGFVWINEPVGWDPPSGMFGDPIYPIDDAIWFTYTDARHHGTVTLTYEYSAVPEPGMLMLLGIGGLAILKRRR